MNLTERATQILAGLLANPNVVSTDRQYGWSLVNCNDQQIAENAVRLAKALEAAAEVEQAIHGGCRTSKTHESFIKIASTTSAWPPKQ